MTPELGAALLGLITAATAFIKSYTGQSSIKKNLEAEISELRGDLNLLRERVNRLDKLDEKFDRLNDNVVEVKTQLNMLLKLNGIEIKK